MAKKIVETPLMKQYFEMKSKHPDAVMLFRVGDFYETFSDDAVVASEILGITLTKRANGAAQSVELAGFPHHALDTYLPKLVRAGKRVAICEQLEDPKTAKKLVKRGITELVTPGVTIGDNILDGRRNNFLCAVAPSKKEWGMALLDISTGEFLCAQGDRDYVAKLIGKFGPKEVLVERGNKAMMLEGPAAGRFVFELDDWVFTAPTARERLHKHFGVVTLKGFGVEGMTQGIIAAGACLQYLDITNHTNVAHISCLLPLREQNYVHMDPFTINNLEIVRPLSADGRSLLDILDCTLTPMGSRLMRRWILFPLKDIAAINARLDVVEYFFKHPDMRESIADTLRCVGDMERLVGKAAACRVSPRELVQLRTALEAIEPLKASLAASGEEALEKIAVEIEPCAQLRQSIASHIVDNAPAALNRGEVIRQGVDAELDDLRQIAYHGKDYLLKLQQRESEATGIQSLKVGFNNVFGYYLEVTNTHRDKVPAEWIRKQTLVNAERYITTELKEYEEKILGAEVRIAAIEKRIYDSLVEYVVTFSAALQRDALQIASLDCLLALAGTALKNRYNRPVVDESYDIEIVEGRHPVIECQLPAGEPYISNSVRLSNTSTQIMMITGPNMSGKSALLRQCALTVLMAQMGGFVPAQSARIGIVDKIFTRVGASDNISQGESTFMVEMSEAAAILNNLSPRSLVLFDELGRGTSTYDGISIAWSIVEYIHNHPTAAAKTLFATHYHELNDMESDFERVVNYNVAVQENAGKVVFLRKLVKGGSEHSFGIHVAKLAGMPQQIVRRAGQVLANLESHYRADHSGADTPRPKAPSAGSADGVQLTFFQLDDPVLSQIRDELLRVDIDNLTPVAALTKLNDIKSILTGKS
ncbi:MAG: DNA mismatch repair protein MutS [Muribaculaceae bacterium]|nr:DNA mismatch repair protein MutS [Muribaculaceae bacterium]